VTLAGLRTRVGRAPPWTGKDADQAWLCVAAYDAGGISTDCRSQTKPVSEDLPPSKLPARTQCRDHRHRSTAGGSGLARVVERCVVPGTCEAPTRRIRFLRATCSDGLPSPASSRGLILIAARKAGHRGQYAFLLANPLNTVCKIILRSKHMLQLWR
jgi:hypothetical protein